MKMTLMQHFKELRNRVLWSLLFFVLAFVAGFYFSPMVQDFIMAPLMNVWKSGEMIYTGIEDALMIQFSLAGLFAMLASMPFVLYHLWKYVAPALKQNEKKIIVPLIIVSPLLFISGAAFAYFILLPMMFEFFISIGSDSVKMLPNVKNYLSFSIDILKAFGLAFQFPLVLIILNRAKLLSRKSVLSLSRYIIVGIFILAAILTPPDIISQIALALPLVVLFALSLLFMI